MNINPNSSPDISLAVIIALVITALVIVILVMLTGMCYITNRRRERKGQARRGLEMALAEVARDVHIQNYSNDASTAIDKEL